nr:CopD family protein [Chloroflexia bacterium]
MLATRRSVLLVVLVVLGLALSVESASAHAFLDRSDPQANDVASEVPESVRLWFTEPLEVEYSQAELFDVSGQRIETEASIVGPDPYQLTLPLPANLPNGTYSVQWRNISAADGHPETGYVPFTIGSGPDVAIPVPPAQVDFGGPPAALNAVGRWLSLLGVAGVAGTLVTWFWVIRPSRSALSPEHRLVVAQRVRRVALVSVVVAIVGGFVALAVQVSTAGSALSVPDTLRVINDTRFGTLWSIRVVLLLSLGVFLYLPYTWREMASPLRWAGLGLAAAAMLPFSLNSHAAVPGEGRAAAVVVDWIHLGASSVWVGGLIAVLVGMVYATRGAPRKKRLAAYALLVPRFSTLAIASVIILSVTGFYASWLQVGNLIALRETSYGQTLAIKVGLMLLMVALGAVNLFIIGPRLRRSATGGIQLGRTVAAEVVLGVLVLFMVGLLTSLPTARDTINSESGRTVFHLADQDVHMSLYVSPGAVGANRYTADVDLPLEDIPAGSEVLLRTTPAADLEGVRQVTLSQTTPGRFEASGSELSIVGEWQLEVLLRRPAEIDWRAGATTTIRNTPPEERAPDPAPRFTGVNGAIWVTVLSVGIVIVVAGMRSSGGRGVAAFGAVLIVLSLGGLGFTRETPVEENPIQTTDDSVATGQQLFLANCADCHGSEGTGDGPRLAGFDAPNADLTAAHLLDHSEGQLHRWILEGIGGTMMPGFADDLTDEETWHLVNYVLSLHETAS